MKRKLRKEKEKQKEKEKEKEIEMEMEKEKPGQNPPARKPPRWKASKMPGQSTSILTPSQQVTGEQGR